MERRSGIPLLIAAMAVGGLVLFLSGHQLLDKPPSAVQPKAAISSFVAQDAARGSVSEPTRVTESGEVPEGLEERERLFRATDTPVETKKQIASDLVGTAQDNGEYFEYLHQVAAEAIAFYDNVPAPLDATAPVTDEFRAWASNNELTEGEALMLALYNKPLDVSRLGILGDPRAFQVLSTGLLSPNIGIRLASADGLALIGDPAAIPLIVAAAERDPNHRLGFAKTLAYFDDPVAIAKTEEWVTDSAVLESLRESAAYERSVRSR